MYSPIGSKEAHRTSSTGSIPRSEESLNNDDTAFERVELGHLPSTSLLEHSSTEALTTFKPPLSRLDETSYAKSMSLPEESDASIAIAQQSTRPATGWWAHQMLIDRSARTMAACMTVLANLMLCTCIALANPFSKLIHSNKQSTSVSISEGSKEVVNRKSEALKFFINVAATMVLGMSNTYQQFLTALDRKNLGYVLAKRGDSRVGTNSPISINHKRKGRTLAWLAWVSLVLTSLPVHLLANSLVGVADHQSYNVPILQNATNAEIDWTHVSYDCYSAFRLGKMQMLNQDWPPYLEDLGPLDADDRFPESCVSKNKNNLDTPPEQYCTVGYTISYSEERCAQYYGDTTPDQAETLFGEWGTAYNTTYYSTTTYSIPLIGTCYLTNLTCSPIYDSGSTCSNKQYRLVVRMQAAIILAFCLTYKAVYMLICNFRSRDKVKTHMLTFGDVLMASVMDPTVQIPRESMVNGGTFHRRQVRYTCHKHCQSGQVSETGEELGHCQKCSKFNLVDNMTKLAWPALVTKRKQSLLANLGQTALTQMLTLSFSSVGMIVASVFALLGYISAYADPVRCGWTTYAAEMMRIQPIAQLHMSNISGETMTFGISNGAQLLYSMLYMLLIYNVTLISMEQDWAELEKGRRRLRCTIVKSDNFDQSYLLQLPKRWLFPLMTYSVMMHWLLGLAIYAEESIISDGVRAYSKY